MIGPTWSDVASAPAGKIERREVPMDHVKFHCPFCNRTDPRRKLQRSGGHRCGCGALFYEQQAVSVHFKERE